MNAANYKPR